jgi:uncharacterized protein with HEPN domain
MSRDEASLVDISVDLEEVWSTARRDVPGLLASLEALLPPPVP